MLNQQRTNSSQQHGELTDEGLWDNYKHLVDDDNCWNTLYHRLRPRVYGLIMRILYDPVEAQDLTQETMVRVLNSDFDPQRGKLLKFVLKIARNLALDELRRRKVRAADSLDEPQNDDEDEPLSATLPDTMTPWPDAVLLSREQTQALRHCLNCLNDNEKTILVMWIDGISQKEIGKDLELAYGTVRNCLGRALRKLRQCYENYEGGQLL